MSVLVPAWVARFLLTCLLLLTTLTCARARTHPYPRTHTQTLASHRTLALTFARNRALAFALALALTLRLLHPYTPTQLLTVGAGLARTALLTPTPGAWHGTPMQDLQIGESVWAITGRDGRVLCAAALPFNWGLGAASWRVWE